MIDFLSVPHHQLLIGLGLFLLLQVCGWLYGAYQSRVRLREQVTTATETQARHLELRERILKIESQVSQDLTQARREGAEQARSLRQELQQSIMSLGEGQQNQLGVFETRLKDFKTEVAHAQTRQHETLDKRLTELRDVFVRTGLDQRTEANQILDRLGEQQRTSTQTAAETQKERLTAFERRLDHLTETLGAQLEKLREENDKRLEEMRRTVDEKLQSTLEKRLGESFTVVSERLESVYKGLGEMQSLATSVGDLKRVFSNVKMRGTWGEVQLAQLLSDMLTPDQYGANVAVVPGKTDRVEFAIRLPGQDTSQQVWLPIDAKFPHEDYERLITASEAGDIAAVDQAAKALEKRVLGEAKGIAMRYLAPPHTTDFGILYLPTEGLYAEIARREGLTNRIQREHRIIVAGPNTFSALLNSLQMGFRTLAIQQRSSEVWQILGEVKTEFGKFGDALQKVKDRLQMAEKDISAVEQRTRAMSRKLKGVEEIPASVSALLPGLQGDDTEPGAAQPETTPT